MTRLPPKLASRFARLTLDHVERQWPHKLDHVAAGPADIRAPIELHPLFHGSFDWHSCVHGWWLLMRVLRRFPDIPEAPEIRECADRLFVPDKVAAERAYFERPEAAASERPYGWAWLLALHSELLRHPGPWSAALAPLAELLAGHLCDYLDRLPYPIRSGAHFNTGFALLLARGPARTSHPALAAAIDEHARGWFGGDRDWRGFEPSGDDFLSPVLVEALLMRRVLGDAAFAPWLAGLLPRLAEGEPATVFEPVRVTDRSDGKIAHLDGLNLSRAWCWTALADALPDPARARDTAARHLAASLPHIDEDFAGSHWLASFALLAIEGVGWD